MPYDHGGNSLQYPAEDRERFWVWKNVYTRFKASPLADKTLNGRYNNDGNGRGIPIGALGVIGLPLLHQSRETVPAAA